MLFHTQEARKEKQIVDAWQPAVQTFLIFRVLLMIFLA